MDSWVGFIVWVFFSLDDLFIVGQDDGFEAVGGRDDGLDDFRWESGPAVILLFYNSVSNFVIELD